MNVTGVRVKIYNEERCIHEHETVQPGANDLNTLMQNLRDVQSEVNGFLTKLIQRQDVSGDTANRSISSDVESDSVEEDEDEEEEEEGEKGEARANPKKCKLSA